MIQPCTIDGLTFVGCPSRLGHINKDGPITGKRWEITPMGVWIDEEDAEILTEIIEDVWCFRTERFVPTHTVFFMNPSADEIRRQFDG